MSALIKRAYSRNAYEAPILFANCDTENYYRAKMYNRSLGGMYFESEKALRPGSDICIKMVNHSSDKHGLEALKAYRAKVKWCKKRNKTGISSYGIGIQYLAKIHTAYGENVHELSRSCDLCGEKIPSEKILKNKDLVSLCINCFNYLEEMPESTIKDSIKEFLIGNVI